MRGLISTGWVTTCHDLSDGGLAIALTEMAMAGGIGVIINTGADASAPWLFGEDQGRYLISCSAEKASEILSELQAAGLTARQIGLTGGDAISFAGGASVPLKTLRDLHEGWFPSYMAA